MPLTRRRALNLRQQGGVESRHAVGGHAKRMGKWNMGMSLAQAQGGEKQAESASPSLLTTSVRGPLAPPINLFLHRLLPRADRPPLFSCLFLRVCQLVPMCWRELTGEEERALRKLEGISSGRRSCVTGFCEAFQPGPRPLSFPSCSCPWISSSRLSHRSWLYVPGGLCPGCPPSLPKLPPHPAPMSHPLPSSLPRFRGPSTAIRRLPCLSFLPTGLPTLPTP